MSNEKNILLIDWDIDIKQSVFSISRVIIEKHKQTKVISFKDLLISCKEEGFFLPNSILAIEFLFLCGIIKRSNGDKIEWLLKK